MGHHLVVRRARPADADEIGRIHVAAWQAAYRGMLPDALLDGLDASERSARWRSVIADGEPPGWRVLVARRDRNTLGFSVFGPSRDEDADATRVGELNLLYLDPPVIGTGAGAALMRATTAGLRAYGFREATLWVLEANLPARRFYRGRGWVPDGARKEFKDGVYEVRYCGSL